MNNSFIHELEPELQQKLSLLKEVPARDAGLKASARTQYLAQLKQFSTEQNSVGLNAVWPFATKKNRAVERIPSTWSWRTAPARAFALAVVVVLVLLSGLGATAYAAQNSLPTSAMYPLKVLSENIRLELTSDPESKFDLVLTYADIRIDEISALQTKGDEIVEPVVDRLENQFNLALLLASEMPDEAMSQSLEQVRTTTQIQLQAMTTLRESAPAESIAELERVQAMLERQQYMAQNGLTDPEAFREAVQNEFENGNSDEAPGNQNGQDAGNSPGAADSAQPQSGPGRNDQNSAQPGQGVEANPLNNENPGNAPVSDQGSQLESTGEPGGSGERIGEGQELNGFKKPGLEEEQLDSSSMNFDTEMKGWNAKYGNPMYWYSIQGMKNHFYYIPEYVPFDGSAIFTP